MLKDIFYLLVDRKDFFVSLTLEHIAISLVVICIAIVLGLLLGIIISEYRASAKLTLGFINIVYTIPSIALLGFLIPFSGVGNTTAIIALTIYALLPMVRSTYTGIDNIDKNILEAAKGMGSTDRQILFRIKLPLALPVIMSAVRNMVTMTIALTGISSFIGAGGLGVAIYRGIATNNTTMTMVGSLLIALLALAMDWILGTVENETRLRRKRNKLRTTIKVSILATLVVLIIGSVFYKPNSENTIRIATKPGTEQYIIGEMLKILIEQDTELKVKLTTGIGGGTSNIHPAMIKGDFDMYPEYTGTAWNVVLKWKEVYNETLFDSLQNYYNRNFDMSWVGMYGFNNTFALAVRSSIARQYGLSTCSDVTPIASQLIFGAEYDYFERQDGYEAFCSAYGFRFKKGVDMDMALKYHAINEGRIDAMNVFTTDGLISVSDIKVLTDDKKFFPSYRCGTIVRNQVLSKHPELSAVLDKLNGKIDEETMRQMNYRVENEGKEPKQVAMDFLKKAGLLKKKMK